MLAGASLNQQQEPASGTGKQLEFAYTKAGAMCLPPSPPGSQSRPWRELTEIQSPGSLRVFPLISYQ
jgi:hypothetical protein